MAEIKVFGYASKISVKPGDEISFHVHADGTNTAEAQLVRLIHGDQHPAGPGYLEEEIKCSLDGTWEVKKQYTQVGNFLTVNDPDRKLALAGDSPSAGLSTRHSWGWMRQALFAALGHLSHHRLWSVDQPEWPSGVGWAWQGGDYLSARCRPQRTSGTSSPLRMMRRAYRDALSGRSRQRYTAFSACGADRLPVAVVEAMRFRRESG